MWRQLSKRIRPSVGSYSSTAFLSHSPRQAVIAAQSSKSNDHNYDQSTPGSKAAFTLFLAIAGSASLSVANCDSSKKKATEQTKFKVIPRSEVEKHNSIEKGVWVTYQDGVYDVTHFIQNHPGGVEKLMSVAGKDIASMWALYAHHKTSPLALDLLAEMKIGVLPPKDVIIPPKTKYSPKYSNKPVYDVIIIGSGLSGLQCGWSLVNQYKVNPEKILVLEAQDYVGGRVKQITEFVKGAKIDVGAEFLHGNNTELTKFAKAQKEPLREIYCWAHGDGGPEDEAVDHGYGLYYVGKADLNKPGSYRLPKPYKDDDKQQKLNSKDRLMRYDDKENPDFMALNDALHELEHLHEDDFDEKLSLYDWLLSKKLNLSMIKMGEGGFANTLCANSNELSLKQAIRWSRIWHLPPGPDEDPDSDFTFKNSFGCIIDHLKKPLQVEVNTPVQKIVYDPEEDGKTKSKEGNIVKVITNDGVEYQAKNIVVTASPHVIQNKLLNFSPALPEEIEDAYNCVKMNSVIKVFLKFSEPVWPYNLHGMIMQDDNFLLPEIWFRNVEDEIAPGEKATAYAIGFATSEYCTRLSQYSQEEVLQMTLKQLEQVFSHLEPKHMSEDPNDPKNAEALKKLKKPSEAYLGGMFWDWRPTHHPYIGGGYCSPLAGKPIRIGEVLKKGNGKHMFFAGEATNDRPGATAHSALETGIRAAGQVAAALKQN
jgi:monoamine oxidase/cytochrome b involved in lipid metabolism